MKAQGVSQMRKRDWCFREMKEALEKAGAQQWGHSQNPEEVTALHGLDSAPLKGC